MATIAIGIVAHHSRLGAATKLASQLHANPTIDWEDLGERWCHQETLRHLLDTDADWYVLLEDDAIPCANFTEHVTEALDEAPSPIVSLYLGTGRWAGTVPKLQAPYLQKSIALAEQHGAEWILGKGMWHAVAIAVRRDHAASLLAHWEGARSATDLATSGYIQAHRIPVAYTWPSHVDHDDSTRIVTTGDKPVTRRAWAVV